jgi:hypothetical protein
MTEGQFAQLNARMDNWGRWAHVSSGANGHCASVEHRYVPPRLGEGEQACDRITQAINSLDAEIVERAVVALRCQAARIFLKKLYVYRASRHSLCDMFKLPREQYRSYWARALEMVTESLRAQDVTLIRRGRPIWAGIARCSGSGV